MCSLKGKVLNVAWTINSHGCADGVVGNRSWYLVMRQEGQRFMMKTRKQRAIHGHIRQNKCCSLLRTGRKETGGSWHKLSNFLLVLTFRCNDWEDERSAPGGGSHNSWDTQLWEQRQDPCPVHSAPAYWVLWAGLQWPQCSPAAFTASCVVSVKFSHCCRVIHFCLPSGFDISATISKENALLPHSAPAAPAGYFHLFINICTKKILDGWVLTSSFN